MEDGQVVAPDFIFGSADILRHADIRNIARALWRTRKLHAAGGQELVALPSIAPAAAGDQIVPVHPAPGPFRQDMVNGQIAGLDAAILAGVVVAGEDGAPGQLEIRQRPLDMVAQADN